MSVPDCHNPGHYDVDEHLLSPQEVAGKYEVHVDFANISGASKGLSALQVKERQAKYGQNRLTPPKETPEWVKFLLQFTNPLMLLLLVAGGLTYMACELVHISLMVLLLAVVWLCACYRVPSVTAVHGFMSRLCALRLVVCLRGSRHTCINLLLHHALYRISVNHSIEHVMLTHLSLTSTTSQMVFRTPRTPPTSFWPVPW